MLPGWRSQFQNKFRLALTLLGILLGTALCTFIILINEATLNSLNNSVQDLVGDTDLLISATGGESFPEASLDRVLKLPGIASAAPVIQKKVFVRLPSGDQTSLMLLGIDLLNDSSVRSHGDGAGRLIADPLAFMAAPDSVAVTKSFSLRAGLRLNDTLEVVTATGLKKFSIRALVDDKGPGKTFDGNIAVLDIEAARLAFGKNGKTDVINVSLEKKSDLPKQLVALQDLLGESFNIEPPSSQLQSLRDVIAPFQALLSFLGVLAFVMAFSLILNTARLSISERRREMATLRAIGIGKQSLFSVLLGEYFVFGLIGSALGSFGAWELARIFIGTLQQGLVAQTQTSVQLQANMLPIAVPTYVAIMGAVVTMAAVLLPIWRVVRTSPTEIFSGAVTQVHDKASSRVLRAASLLIGALMLAPLLPFQFPKNPLFDLAPMIGALLVGPPLAVFLLVQSRRLSHLGTWPILALAWGYAVSNPRRVESALRGLVLSLLLIFLISSIQAGFTNALSRMFIRTARPDFYVSSTGDFLNPMTLQPLQENLQPEIAKVQGIDGVYGQRIISLHYKGHAVKLSAFDEVPPNTLDTPYSYFEVVDRPVEMAGRDLYHGDPKNIFVSESFRSLFNKKTGDTIELGVLDRKETFKIVGVVRDFTAGGGRIYLSRDRYKTLWQDPLLTGIAIVLKAGADLSTVRAAVESKFGPSQGLMTTVDRGIKKDVEGILNKSFVTFELIELVCVLVASLGFLSSFFITIQNRKGELGAMRAIGCSRRELTVFLATEAGLLGAGASLATLILAPAVAWRVISRTMPNLLGWVVEYQFDFLLCGMILALGTGLASLASLYAIRWAQKFDIAEGVQSE